MDVDMVYKDILKFEHIRGTSFVYIERERGRKE